MVPPFSRADKELIKLFKAKQKKYPNIKLTTFIKRWCGEQLGSGEHRTVYAMKGTENIVIKIENKPGVFANIKEYVNFNEHGHTDGLGEFLCPVIIISETGNILLMRRSRPIKSFKELPERIIKCLIDLKIENFGWLGDQLVCHDYSLLAIGQCITGPMPTKRARWWSLDRIRNRKAKRM